MMAADREVPSPRDSPIAFDDGADHSRERVRVEVAGTVFAATADLPGSLSRFRLDRGQEPTP
jgi:hypothetical protein